MTYRAAAARDARALVYTVPTPYAAQVSLSDSSGVLTALHSADLLSGRVRNATVLLASQVYSRAFCLLIYVGSVCSPRIHPSRVPLPLSPEASLVRCSGAHAAALPRGAPCLPAALRGHQAGGDALPARGSGHWHCRGSCCRRRCCLVIPHVGCECRYSSYRAGVR